MAREFTRAQRLASRALRILADMHHSRLRDPRLSGVQFTHVRFSRDLGVCRIWYLPGPAGAEATAASLRSACGYMRKLFGESLRLRRQPELRFVRDDTQARGDALARRIEEAVRREEQVRAGPLRGPRAPETAEE